MLWASGGLPAPPRHISHLPPGLGSSPLTPGALQWHSRVWASQTPAASGKRAHAPPGTSCLWEGQSHGGGIEKKRGGRGTQETGTAALGHPCPTVSTKTPSALIRNAGGSVLVDGAGGSAAGTGEGGELAGYTVLSGFQVPVCVS